MSAVWDWLEAIGLGQYADAFEANDIDSELLPQIDDQLLKDIGVSSAGHRLRIRNAIAKLTTDFPAEPNPASALAAADASGGFCRAAPADGDVLRSGRLHGDIGAARPGGSTRGDRSLSPLCRGGGSPFRRFRRQIHG